MPLLKKIRTISGYSSSESEEITEIDLVLSSSGVRAPSFIGGIRAIQDKGIQIKRIAGTSGGAIVAAGFALGMSLEEMASKAINANYKAFKDFSVKNLASLKNPSLYSGRPLEEFYQSLFGNACLGDFQIDCKITVVAVGGQRRRVVLDKQSHARLPVWQAVRMSSSIPFVFPYKYLNGVPVTDGGLVVDELFDVFPEQERLTICLRPRSSPVSPVTDSDTETNVYIWTLIRSIIDFLFDAVDNQNAENRDLERVIIIPTGSITAFDFGMTKEEVEKLIEYGYDAVSQSRKLPNSNPR